MALNHDRGRPAIPKTFFTVWHNVFNAVASTPPGETFLVMAETSALETTPFTCQGFWARVFAKQAGPEAKCAAIRELGVDLLSITVMQILSQAVERTRPTARVLM